MTTFTGNENLCLLDIDGKDTIDSFDNLEKSIREIIKSSPFNLCPVCIMDKAVKIESNNHKSNNHLAAVLEAMHVIEELYLALNPHIYDTSKQLNNIEVLPNKIESVRKRTIHEQAQKGWYDDKL